MSLLRGTCKLDVGQLTIKPTGCAVKFFFFTQQTFQFVNLVAGLSCYLLALLEWIWFDARSEFNASLNSLNPVSETYEFGVGVTCRRDAFFDLHRVLNLLMTSVTCCAISFTLWLVNGRLAMSFVLQQRMTLLTPESRYDVSKADELL